MLKARCAGPDWFRHLPWILLHFRTTPAEVYNISPAHHLYGATLTLPLQLSSVPPALASDPLLSSPPPLQQLVSHNLSPSFPPSFVSPALLRVSHVFIRHDAAPPPLSPLFYTGPFLVLPRTPHYFTLQLDPSTDNVSVLWLKPTSLYSMDSAAIPQLRAVLPAVCPLVFETPLVPPVLFVMCTLQIPFLFRRPLHCPHHCQLHRRQSPCCRVPPLFPPCRIPLTLYPLPFRPPTMSALSSSSSQSLRASETWRGALWRLCH